MSSGQPSAGGDLRVLVADDSVTVRGIVREVLTRSGHQVELVDNGRDALESLIRPAGPQLAVLDRQMPLLDGIEVCRRLRAGAKRYVHVIILTAQTQPEEILDGLNAGADDYLGKPFSPTELVARIRTGERVVRLENRLASRIRELEEAREKVRRLEGVLPICMHCKRIRSAEQGWETLEAYIEQRSDARFSHSICEPCMSKHHPE